MAKNIVWQKPDGSNAVTISTDQINGFPVGTLVDEEQTVLTPTAGTDADGNPITVNISSQITVKVQQITFENSTIHAERLQTPDENGSSILPTDWIVVGVDLADISSYLQPPAPPVTP